MSRVLLAQFCSTAGCVQLLWFPSAAGTFLSFPQGPLATLAVQRGHLVGWWESGDSACSGQQDRANFQLEIGLWGTLEHYSTKLYLNISVYTIDL